MILVGWIFHGGDRVLPGKVLDESGWFSMA